MQIPYLTVIIMIVTVIFSQKTYSDEIHLKNGRIIEADHCWEDGNTVKYQKYDTEVIIDKKNVKKIVYLTEKEAADRTLAKQNKLKEMKDKYDTSGGIIMLKDGKTIQAEKTWFDDGNIGYFANDKTSYIEEHKVDQIIKSNISISKVENNFSRTKQNKNSSEYLKDGPGVDFIKDGVRYKFIGFAKSKPACIYCPNYSEWYNTENGTEYYWYPQEQRLIKQAMKNCILPGEKISKVKIIEEEPPSQDFFRDGTLYKYLSYRCYETENGNKYCWDPFAKRMMPGPVEPSRQFTVPPRPHPTAIRPPHPTANRPPHPTAIRPRHPTANR